MNIQLLAVSYATAIYALFFNVQPALVGVLQRNFGFSEQQLGLILGLAFGAATMVLASSFFWLNRFRYRSAIATGIATALCGTALLFFAQSLSTVAAGMTLVAAGLAMTAAPVVAILGTLPNPTRAFGVGISAMVIIAALCLFLIPVVLDPLLGYPGVIAFLGLLIAATLFLLPWIPEPGPRHEKPAQGSAPVNRLVWIALLATTLYFAGLNSNWAFLELIGEQLALTTGIIGMSVSAGLMIGALGSIAAAVIHERLGITSVMAITLAGLLLYTVVLGWAEGAGMSFWPYILAVALLNIAWNFSLPYCMELVRSYDSDGRFLGLVPAAQMLGGAIGPFTAGILLADYGVLSLYFLLIGCVLIAALIYVWLNRHLRMADAPSLDCEPAHNAD